MITNPIENTDLDSLSASGLITLTNITSRTGTVSGTVSIPSLNTGRFYILRLYREQETTYATSNLIYYGTNYNANKQVVICLPNNNSGATIFSKVTVNQTSLSFSDWYCGYEFTGVLGQNLVTKFDLLRIDTNVIIFT